MNGRGRLIVRKPIGARDPLVRQMFERMESLPGNIDYHAEQAGIDRWPIYRWRRGKSLPSLSNLEAMVAALGGRLVIEWGEAP